MDSPGRVIGIAGRIGSGKTTLALALAGAYGFQYVRYSQVLRAWFPNASEDRAGLQAAGWAVMSGGKQAELNERLIASLRPASGCIVDGLRHPIDFDSLKAAFGARFHLIFLDCSPEDRWARAARSSRFSNRADFDAADGHAVERSIDLLRPLSDFAISCAQVPDAIERSAKALMAMRTEILAK